MNNKPKWYEDWHQNPRHAFYHWAIFIIIVFVSSSFLLGQINDYAYGEENTAAVIRSNELQPVAFTNQLLHTLKKFQSVAPADRSIALDNLLSAVRARKQFMEDKIKNDPGAAILAALPEGIAKQLPEEVTSLIERNTEESGSIDVIQVDMAEGGGPDQLLFYLNTPHGKVQLHFKEDPTDEGVPSSYLTGDIVSARGVLLDNDMALSVKDTTLLKDPLPNTFGPQKTLVILVNFSDLATQPYTTSSMYAKVFSAVSPGVNAFDAENSYGQSSLTGNIIGWYTIPIIASSCTPSLIKTYAWQAAQAAGYNPSLYQHVVYGYPDAPCGFPYQSTVGGNPSDSWIGDASEGTIAHELGHAMGLYHAHTLLCGSSVYNPGGTGCTLNEYGGLGAVGGGYVHFNSFHKELLGWLNYNAEPPIQTITTGGAYTIAPYESNDSGMKALKILQSGSTNTYYYIEYRAGLGSFDNGSLVTPPTSGIYVDIASPSNANSSDLLNMGAATGSGWSLKFGQSYTDASIGVTFTPVSANTSGAVVNITFGPVACVKVSPTITIAPISETGTAGGSLNYTVTVANNNNSGCSSATYNLAALSLPTGFTSSFSLPTLSLSSGAKSSSTLVITAPTGFADSSNVYSVSATDGADATFTGQSSATYIVYTPVIDTISPSVSITSPGNGTVISGNSIAISAFASDNVAVTKVTFTIDGKIVATDSTAPYSYKWQIRKVTAGQHAITANAYDAAGNVGTASVTVMK